MRKQLLSLLTAVGLVLLIATPALAYIFRAPLTILEANGTAYTMLAVRASVNNKYLAANGFLSSTARDTTAGTTSSTSYPHMVSDSYTLTATALPANGQVNLYYYTGETPADFDIIPGYGGYVTVADAAALEFGNNFESEFSGYVDTSAAMVGQNLVYKDSAYRTYVSATGSITSAILAPSTETLVPNAAGDYTNIPGASPPVAHYLNVDDPVGAPDDATTYVYNDSVAQLKDAYNLVNTAIPSNAIINSVTVYFRVMESADGFAQPFLRLGGVETAGTEIAVTGSWITYSGLLSRPGGGSWLRSDLDSLQVAIGLRNNTGLTYLTQVYVSISYSYTVASVTATVTSGDHVIKTVANGTTIKIYEDGVEEGSAAVATVPNNTNNWVLMSNAAPYWSYYKHTVGGTLIVHYAPNDIIHGAVYSTGTVTVTNGDATVEGAGGATWADAHDGGLFVSTDSVQYVIDSITDSNTLELMTVYGGGTLAGQPYNMYVRLPDRQGAAQNGRITFGSNPAGVTATLNSFVSGSQPAPGVSDAVTIPRDLMPEVPVSDHFQDPDLAGVLLNNPLRPFVTIPSSTTPMTELESWRLLGGAFILVVFALSAKFLRGHYLIVGIATGAAIGATVAMTIYPLIFLIGVIMCVLAGIVAERMPSVG